MMERLKHFLTTTIYIACGIGVFYSVIIVAVMMYLITEKVIKLVVL